MAPYSEIVDKLKREHETVDIANIWAFMSLHKWLLHHHYLRRDSAIVIILHGASYVIYPDYPSTTLVVYSESKHSREDFSFISQVEFFGEFGQTYTFGAFLREILAENKIGLGLILGASSLVAFVREESNLIGLVIDKSIDVAAIAAAFLTLFLSFKTEPRQSDYLWFKRGEYVRHFRIDRYSLTLIASSLVMFFLLLLLDATFGRTCAFKPITVSLLSIGWFCLFVGFRIIMTYHIDRLESDGAKQLADAIRYKIKESYNRR